MSKSILITGGTGSFGREFVKLLLEKNDYHRIVIYSRDEQKQEQMRRELVNPETEDRLRFFLGDVRDKDRLKLALKNVDDVVHAAALKIVPTGEYNPTEFVKTNILGAQNIVEILCEKDKGQKLIALSTDKSVWPVNLYGATKLVMEKLFIAANQLSGGSASFSIMRYGNVSGSRGSVIPLFKHRARTGKSIPVTDPEMTRFWYTLPEAAKFTLRNLKVMKGGEIFIPEMESYKILDLAQIYSVKYEAPIEIIGARPGEKLHESIYTKHEARYAIDDKGVIII